MERNIFDSHSHYDDEQFDGDRNDLLASLPQKGVELAVSCGCDLETCEKNRQIAEKYDYIYFAAGFHPENLEGTELSQIEKSRNMRRTKNALPSAKSGLITTG